MNGRLQRAKAIVAHKDVVVDAFTVYHPEFGNVRMGTYVCQSQSRPDVTHKGSFMYNGHLIEEETSCSCEDWLNDNLCMHVTAAMLADGASEEVIFS